jgi:uncharacterized protein (TIGR02453 family)
MVSNVVPRVPFDRSSARVTFTGFTREASDFFAQLAQSNNREFFVAHRDVYERVIRQPLEDLLAEAERVYGPGRVMRPNRDVRFAADKTPYRTNGGMWAGDVGGVYLSVSKDGLETGGGLYDPTRDQLDRARIAIDSKPLAASALKTILSTLEDDGFSLAGPSLKTAPRGYERDNPAIDLLRLKHYAALRKLPVDAGADQIREAWEKVGPLNAWANEHIGPAEL